MAAASDDAVTGSAGEDADRQHSCAMALALEAIAGGHSFLLTGAAGTGKSFFVGNLVRELDARLSSTLGCDGSYFVTAMTGAAATLLDVKGCTTFHSAFGITTGEETVAGWCEKVRRRRHLYEELRALTACIVDECSMMSQDLFDELHLVLQEIRDCPDKPFGGVVVVFSGDFFQIPPVTRQGTAAFLFSSPSFPSLVPFRWELSCYVRHASDAAYLSMLRDLRVGRNTAQVRTYLDGLVSPLAQRSVSEGGFHHTICLLSTRGLWFMWVFRFFCEGGIGCLADLFCAEVWFVRVRIRNTHEVHCLMHMRTFVRIPSTHEVHCLMHMCTCAPVWL